MNQASSTTAATTSVPAPPKIFPVYNLQIRLNLNTSPEGTETIFTRTMLNYPQSNDMPNLGKTPASMPYITTHVKYPEEIESETKWQRRLEFLFNKDIFMNKLNSYINEYPEKANYLSSRPPKFDPASPADSQAAIDAYYKQLRENELHNIMITLRCLFQLSSNFGYALTNSYENILLRKTNPRIIGDMNVIPELNTIWGMQSLGILPMKKYRYSLKNLGNNDKGEYSVANAIWVNDLANHPNYSKFILDYYNFQREMEQSVAMLTDKLQETMNILSKALDTSRPIDAAYADLVASISQTNPTFKRGILNKDSVSILQSTLTPPQSFSQDQKTNITTIYSNNQYISRLLISIELNKTASNARTSTIVDSKHALRENAFDNIIAKFKQIIEINKSALPNSGLSQEDILSIAGILISIEDLINEYTSASSDSVNTFFSGELANYYKDLIFKTIAVSATNRILNSASNKVVLNLSGKNRDGTDESKTIQRMNEYIKKNYGSDATTINNLMTSVLKVIEPTRKTSNAELYSQIKHIRFGEIPPSNSQNFINQQLVEVIYKNYIATISPNELIPPMNPYALENAYTGVDIISASTKPADQKSETKNSEELLYEIYVIMDLVSKEQDAKLCNTYSSYLANQIEQLMRSPNPYQIPTDYRELKSHQKTDAEPKAATAPGPAPGPVSK